MESRKGGDPVSLPEAQGAGSDEIEFDASVARVKTMADGGLRFEFDAPENATMQAAQLMECKRFGVALKIVVTPLKNNKEQHAVSEGQKRKSEWKTAQE